MNALNINSYHSPTKFLQSSYNQPTWLPTQSYLCSVYTGRTRSSSLVTLARPSAPDQAGGAYSAPPNLLAPPSGLERGPFGPRTPPTPLLKFRQDQRRLLPWIRDVFLSKQLLPVMGEVSGEFFVFQEGTPARDTARDTVRLLEQATPAFIPTDLWPANSPDLNPVDYRI